MSEYLVVMQAREIPWQGPTWTAYPSKEEFDKDFAGPMQDESGKKLCEVYQVVAEGVATGEDAIAICAQGRVPNEPIVPSSEEPETGPDTKAQRDARRPGFW